MDIDSFVPLKLQIFRLFKIGCLGNPQIRKEGRSCRFASDIFRKIYRLFRINFQAIGRFFPSVNHIIPITVFCNLNTPRILNVLLGMAIHRFQSHRRIVAIAKGNLGVFTDHQKMPPLLKHLQVTRDVYRDALSFFDVNRSFFEHFIRDGRQLGAAAHHSIVKACICPRVNKDF